MTAIRVAVLGVTGRMGHCLVRGVVESEATRAPFRLVAGFLIHDGADHFTTGAEGVLRLGLALSVAYGKASGAAARC